MLILLLLIPAICRGRAIILVKEGPYALGILGSSGIGPLLGFMLRHIFSFGVLNITFKGDLSIEGKHVLYKSKAEKSVEEQRNIGR